MKHITPNEFVLWILDRLQSAEAPPLKLNDVLAQALTVATDESMYGQAVAEHEQYSSLVRAGFTESQAFRMLLTDRHGRAHGLAMGFGQQFGQNNS